MTNTEIADSLRAMHKHSVPHWTPNGEPDRVSITMSRERLQHLLDAAEMLAPEPVVLIEDDGEGY